MTKTTKKIFSSSLLAFALLSSSAAADDFIFNTKSLVGIEGGYTDIVVENTDPTTPVNESYKKGEAGFKIGAQGEHYRVFLSARNYFVGGEFDVLATFGAEGQYMFNFSKMANFFIGGNVGHLYGKFQIDGENFNREFSDVYYGGDIGFNIHLNETYDLELGARYISSSASDDQNGKSYSFDHLATGYASIIIKFEED